LFDWTAAFRALLGVASSERLNTLEAVVTLLALVFVKWHALLDYHFLKMTKTAATIITNPAA
jgi:hypothetical protein